MATEIKLGLRGLVAGYNVIRKDLKRQKERQKWESRARDVNTEQSLVAGVWERPSLASAGYEEEGQGPLNKEQWLACRHRKEQRNYAQTTQNGVRPLLWTVSLEWRHSRLLTYRTMWDTCVSWSHQIPGILSPSHGKLYHNELQFTRSNHGEDVWHLLHKLSWLSVLAVL